MLLGGGVGGGSGRVGGGGGDDERRRQVDRTQAEYPNYTNVKNVLFLWLVFNEAYYIKHLSSVLK